MISESTSQNFPIRVFWNLEQKQKNVFDSPILNQCSTSAPPEHIRQMFSRGILKRERIGEQAKYMYYQECCSGYHEVIKWNWQLPTNAIHLLEWITCK